MKKVFLYLTLVTLTFMLGSCEDVTTAGMTRITYYAELMLEGETTMFLDKGSVYEEPGYSAVMNGEDVSDQVVVSSNVDTSKSGVYTISYSIVNADGFASTASRKIVVTDPNDPIEGIYLTDSESYRIYDGKKTPYGNSYDILVINNGDGTYAVDDMLGGWYCQRAGYGTAYVMQGIVTVAEDGTITLVSSYVPGWGDSADFLDEGRFDEQTGCMTWHISYAGYLNFYVTMYKR